MEIEVFFPKDNELKDLIYCFYFLNKKSSDEDISYFTFPSTNTAVSISLGCDVVYKENEVNVMHNGSKKIHSSLGSTLKSPKLITLKGPIQIITVYFKPLGLNHFLPKPLSEFVNAELSSFTPYFDYEDMMKSVFRINSNIDKVEMLETYWKSKLIGFEHDILSKAIFELNQDEEISIDKISRNCGITSKTLAFQFKKHLIWKPSNYKRVLRFRKILQKMEFDQPNIKLTEMAFEVDYYDQSHMIKEFKRLTGSNPKRFFKELFTHGSGAVVWKINQ